jgi:hypothetical protein
LFLSLAQTLTESGIPQVVDRKQVSPNNYKKINEIQSSVFEVVWAFFL